MTEEELVNIYPRLYHMAHDGAWPAIQTHGLLSATALLDLYEVKGRARYELESQHRPESVRLQAEGLPGAVIRDQKPMGDSRLRTCLKDGLTPKDWYEFLNARSFFWLSGARIWRLLKARAYRGLPQTVLTVDTAGLVATYRDRVRLSPINSGATLFNPQPRGKETFMPIADFPFHERRPRPNADNVVELVVEYSVPDVAKYVRAVHRVEGQRVLGLVWRGDRATESDLRGPELPTT